MKQRGRKSLQSLTVIEGTFPVAVRPEPPAEFTERQAALWRAVANDEPADYFTTTATRELLKDYVLHRFAAADITVSINQYEGKPLDDKEVREAYHKLLMMRDLENRAAAALATKLRMTNQARYTPIHAAHRSRDTAKGTKPWEA